MKHYLTFTLLAALTLGCNSMRSVPQQQSGETLIAKDAVLKLVSSQFSFTEGPARDAAGNVFFTDQPNNKIWKYSTAGELSLFMDNAGRSNGLYFDTKGYLLACADEKNELWRISPQKKIEVLVSDLDGKKLNGPNDVWQDPKTGNIYFTDPYYQRPYWTRKQADIKEQNVYMLTKERQLVTVATGFTRPNGIVGTANGSKLYIADIGDNKTYVYDIQPDGKLANKKLFTAQGSDGMTLDKKGNLYLTGDGVMVYDALGTRIHTIAVPEKWTANVCFGGANNDELFITASKSVYTLQMKVKGM